MTRKRPSDFVPMEPVPTKKWGHHRSDKTWSWPISFHELHWMGLAIQERGVKGRLIYYPATQDDICKPDYDPFFLFQVYFTRGAVLSGNGRNISRKSAYMIWDGDLTYNRIVDHKAPKERSGRAYYRGTNMRLRKYTEADKMLMEACIRCNLV